jgi:uncharacterized protein (DUF305 family)
MNTKIRLLTPIVIVMGMLGIGSLGIASLRTHPSQNETIAQNHKGMNHRGMMKHNMDVGPANANYDLRFLDSMIPHHQGALVMAEEVLKKSKRPELITLAKSILAAQKKEITQMQQWRKKWYPKAAKAPIMWRAEMNHEMAMTPAHRQSMMMTMSLGEADAEFDRRFLDAMISHHQGAVTMAKDLLLKSNRTQMQKLAQNMILSQQAEIDKMTLWRQKWYPSK